LALDQSTLEGIFAGTITKWSELGSVEGAGNTLTGAGCSSAIQPVVRQDGSGTTHIFKKFLGITDPKTSFEYETGKSADWSELAEGSLSTKWPLAAKTIHPASKGGPELLKLVAATPGSIGYANLADARNVANGGFTGQSASRFWVELENSSKGTAPKRKIKYADPATNGDEAKSGEANCKKTVFSNGVGSFPPPALTAPWNEVTASGTSKTYALCGLTYDLALTHIEAYTGGTVEEAKTVQEYLNYVLAKKGGAAEVIGHDYAPLPKELVSEAVEGVATIG
jgi:ABC-type phosphate transport system substrate-binding protein